MGVMRLAKGLARLLKIGLAAYVGLTAMMLVWTFFWPDPDVDVVPRSDAIVCLGGGMDRRGTLAQGALTRVDRCVQLYEAGLAPLVVFTGGGWAADGPSEGGQMARYAQTLGLPDQAARVEGSARSTLQNALFTLQMVPQATDFILVTEAFHLPRAYASFHWARWTLDLPDRQFALVMSEPVRRTPSGDINIRILARESLALWFNAARAAVYALHPQPDVDWLR